jgi:subtilisin family serine protease
LLALAIAPMLDVPALAELRPRPPVIKPEHTVVDEHFRTNVLTVKFQDGLHIRVRNERLTDFGSNELAPAQALLDSLAKSKWRRVDTLPEETIDGWRLTAQTNLGVVIADVNLQFNLYLAPGLKVAEVIDAFNALDIVELAHPIRMAAPLPVAPDFQPMQGYLQAPTAGVNALATWSACGARGAGIKLLDVECSFNPSHLDLPPVTLTGGTLSFGGDFCENHGTASLGIVGSKDNGVGTTGIAPDCGLLFQSVMFLIDQELEIYDMNIPGAILNAISYLSAGDVLLLELQTDGPLGLVPIEWDKPVYDRIVLATGLGITVVEAAGNGNVNLDDPIHGTGNGGHWPFTQAQDSGAIIVGGGAAPLAFGGSTTERSRLTFSTYGSTVDLQGWGERVATTGYGSLYSSEGNNVLYGLFSGTSSASPVVAGACVLLQSVYKTRTGGVLTPAQVKQSLVATGTPQQSGLNPVTENIGSLPNVKAALAQLLPPVLMHTHVAGTVTLTWKACCKLQATEKLGRNADWMDVQTEGNTYTYTHGPMQTTKFFRLICP